MTKTSHFELECVCGQQIRSTTPTGVCAACDREFRIVWGEQDPQRLAAMAKQRRAI
jgi:hypothetical protein